MPAVTAFCVYPGMAGLAQCDEIAAVVGAALGQGQLVMNLFGLNVASFLQTQFAQRMGGGIAVADAFPGSTVAGSRSYRS